MWRKVVENKPIAFAGTVFTIAGFILTVWLSPEARRFLAHQGREYGWQWLAGALSVCLLMLLLGRQLRRADARRHRKGISEWARQQRNRALDTLPAGAIALNPQDGTHTLRTYYSGSLYIDPPFTVLPSSDTTGLSLMAFVKGRLTDRRRLIVRAQPGQGKSLFLQLLWMNLLATLEAQPDDAIVPILVTLDRVDVTTLRSTHLREDLLEQYAHRQCELPPELLRNTPPKRVTLILDGLDELRAVGLPPTQAGQLLLGLVEAADVVSTRDSFFDLRVSEETASRIGEQICLDPIPFAQFGKRYIEAYCELFGGDGPTVINRIESDACLRAEVARPLVLFMTTDILAHPPEPSVIGSSIEWTRSLIYEIYVYKWLKREELREGSLLTAAEKRHAMQYAAWELFQHSSLVSGPYGDVEVADLVVDDSLIIAVRGHVRASGVIKGDDAQLDRDLRDHCFLVRPALESRTISDPQYRFAHKSFFEFLLAKHVEEELAQDAPSASSIEQLLAAPFPDIVIGFIRESLWSLPRGGRRARAIETSLRLMIDQSSGARLSPALHLPSNTELGVNPSAEMARQQAGNLLPLVASEEYLQILVARATRERSLFVRRGIAVGLALHHDIVDPLESFVTLMGSSKGGLGALSVHVGYNRIYYGDQPRTADWGDDGSPACKAFFARTLAQLKDPEKYERIWCMTFFTLRWLLSSGRDLGEPGAVREGIALAKRVGREARGRRNLLDQEIEHFTTVAESYSTPSPRRDGPPV